MVCWTFTILFGLLYIPAFIHGYFWLWVFPFTAIIALFVHAMIDHAIEQVSKVGDAAKQAKAMIPIFIKMNVVMTVLLSISFVSARWLSEWGYIDRLQYSDMDRSFFEYFLSVFAKGYMLPNMYAGIENHASVQIMVSNLFFMVAASLVLLFTCYKKIKQLFLVLFHKPSYKFLQAEKHSGNLSRWRIYIYMPLVIIIFIITGKLFNESMDIVFLYIFIVILNSLIFITVSNIVSMVVEEQIRPLTNKP